MLNLRDYQVWEGDGVIPSIRKIVGATNPVAAEPGTIRGDYARVSGRNIIHASDSPDNGVREAGALVNFLITFPITVRIY